MDDLRSGSLEDLKDDEWLLAARALDADFAADSRTLSWAAVWEMFLRRHWRGFESPFSERELNERVSRVRGRVMDAIMALPSGERDED